MFGGDTHGELVPVTETIVQAHAERTLGLDGHVDGYGPDEIAEAVERETRAAASLPDGSRQRFVSTRRVAASGEYLLSLMQEGRLLLPVRMSLITWPVAAWFAVEPRLPFDFHQAMIGLGALALVLWVVTRLSGRF